MKIERSAILHEGIVFTNIRHHQIIRFMVEDCRIMPPIPNKDQGFITDTGEFVDRITAAKIAIENGQIKAEKMHNHRELFSEDIF